MSKLSTSLCPNCGSHLDYEQGDKSVMCYACDSLINLEETNANQSTANSASMNFMGNPMAAFLGFDNPESGVIFLENFFDTYDWNAYAETSEIEIAEIADVIKNNKMKNGASALSWYLDYQGLAVPVRKKIEGLATTQEKIGALYNPTDSSEAFRVFDAYCRVSKALWEKKEEIFKQLESALKFAEQQKLDAAQLDAMKADFVALKGLFEQYVFETVKDIAEIPAYAAARKEASRVKREELAAKGIDAEAVYQNAVQQYNTNENKDGALKLFQSIRGYEDSAEYIRKINQYFKFSDQVYRCFGKYFVYKEEMYSKKEKVGFFKKILNFFKNLFKKKKGAEEPVEENVMTLSLYGTTNGIPDSKPLVTGIAQFIKCYGSRMYYFKHNAGIYCYDVFEKREMAVDKGKNDDYLNGEGKYEVGFSTGGAIFFVKKVIHDPEVQIGCLTNKKKAAKEAEARAAARKLNPYCIVAINMATNTSRVIVEEMAEVAEYHNDKLFFTFGYIPVVAKESFFKRLLNFLLRKKKAAVEAKTRLMVCDVASGTVKETLGEDCEIHTVANDHIVYSLWTPNELNRDLHVYNLYTGKDTLIEKNVFEFFSVIDGKIYFTVGNEDYCPLVRIDFNGENREEIMTNVENIIGERGGWLYVKKGGGRNSALVKVSADGKKRVLLCTQFKQLARFVDNSVYYVDTRNALRVVRIDGQENRKLAENVTKVFPCDENLFYVRQEKVNEKETALSLYKMDKDGRNVKKVVFNVDTVKYDPDTKTLYYSKEEDMRYKVFVERKEDKAVFATYHINKFYAMDMTASEGKLVLTMGLPEENAKGCFLVKNKKKTIYKEAPVAQGYRRKGLAAATATEEAKEAGTEVVEEKTYPILKFLPKALRQKVEAFLNKMSSKLPKKADSGKKAGKANGNKKNVKKIVLTVILIYLVCLLLTLIFAGM